VSTFLSFTVLGIVFGAVYGLLAIGLVVTYNTTGVFNFAQGAVHGGRLLVQATCRHAFRGRAADAGDLARPGRETKVLLLDEISMGIAPIVVAHLYELVAAIAAGGVTAIAVEQFAETALGVADRAAIMLHGRVAHAGTPEEMADAAQSAYL